MGIGYNGMGGFLLRYNYVGWRLILNRLPTAMNLVQRNINIQDIRCKWVGARLAWTPFVLELKDLVAAQNSYCGSAKWKKLILSIFQVTTWALWKNRNKVVFNNKLANIGRIKEEIEIYSYFWIKHRAKCGSLSWIGVYEKKGIVMWNYDLRCNNNFEQMVLSVIIKRRFECQKTKREPRWQLLVFICN
ncbi:hypothetical protein Hdeb2414_s0014g00433951 [Helianthus debilis subsp. tardiflorus]